MEQLENDSIAAQIVRTFEAVDRMATAQQHFDEEVQRELQRLWADNAELRDELHALSNRVETLTRARLTEPAEVAERMIFTCRLNPGCNVSWPHIHHADGAVIRVESEDAADSALEEVERVRRLYPHAFGGDAA